MSALLKLFVALAAMTGFTHAAVAQPPAPPAPPPPQPQVESSVTDADLDTFTTIYIELQALNARVQSELAGAESDDEAREIQSRLRDESIGTIEGHGWSADRYNAVADSINGDPELLERAVALIDEKS